MSLLQCGRAVMLWATVALGPVAAQSPVCPECVLASQTALPFGPPQAEFLDNPKPVTFDGGAPSGWSLIARVLSTRPLVFDVIDDLHATKGLDDFCGLRVLPIVDAKLKGVLSQLRFNQLVRVSLFYGGNAEFPNEMVLSELAPDVQLNIGTGTCLNRSGLVISYRETVEGVNVYNDGAIYYQDEHFNGFGNQKLSPAELTQLLRAFSEVAFNGLPAAIPPVAEPDRNSLTLICSRYQHVLLSGLETRLAPLLLLLEALKARATAQSYYLLLYKSKTKLTVLDWPSSRVRVSDVEALQRYGAKIPDTIHELVPDEFLSKLPLTYSRGRAEDDHNRYVYVKDGDRLYRISRPPCGGGRPHCNAFDDLFASPVAQRWTTVSPSFTMAPTGIIWPQNIGLPISQVGSDGQRITRQQYEEGRPFSERLYKGGGNFIDAGYLYEYVRICQIDPQSKPTPCVAQK